MEATNEQAAGLLHRILPPRLEDAGLEDCALPPDSIKEAFLKAASAVKSRATSIFTEDEDEDDCVKDPWPGIKDRTGDVVGDEPEPRPPGPCGGEKGGAVEVGGDEVVVGGGEKKEGDRVIVEGDDVREGSDRACVDGLVGLQIGGGGGGDKDGDDVEEKDGPILEGGYV